MWEEHLLAFSSSIFSLWFCTICLKLWLKHPVSLGTGLLVWHIKCILWQVLSKIAPIMAVLSLFQNWIVKRNTITRTFVILITWTFCCFNMKQSMTLCFLLRAYWSSSPERWECFLLTFKQDQFVLNNNTKVEAALIHFPPLLEHEQTEIAEPVS